MVDFKLIKEFLTRYGSKVTDAETGKEEHGVLAPVRKFGAEGDAVQYLKTGAAAKAEYVLLSLNENGMVKKGASLLANHSQYRVVHTDYYYYANKPLYQRAYLQEELAL